MSDDSQVAGNTHLAQVMSPTSSDKVTIEKLRDRENFPVWKFTFDILADSMDLKEYFEFDEGKQLLVLDEKKEKQAKALLVRTLSREATSHILMCKKASEMYKTFHTMWLESSSMESVFQIRKEFKNTKFKGKNLDEHFSKMLSLRSRLREMNEDVSDVEFCSQVLESLPESQFGSVTTAILLTPKDEMKWEKMRTDLSAFWNRLRRKDQEEVALVSRAPQVQVARARNNNNGGGARHRRSNNNKVCFAFRDSGFCRFGNQCRFKHVPNVVQGNGDAGHRVFVAVTDEANQVDVQSESKVQASTLIQVQGKTSVSCGDLGSVNGDSENVKWVVDSGATRHMSKESKDVFQDFKYSEIGVSLGDNSKLLSVGVGSVGRVSDVLKVDSLTHNLLSVVQALEAGIVQSVVFTKAECTFLDAKGAVVASAVRRGNLFVYEENVSVSSCEANVVASEDMLVHRRYCHMNGESDVHIIDCEDCLKAKFTRLPYNDSSTPRVQPGLRLFGDIQGKFPESFGGKFYSFPLLDDGSDLIIPTFLSLKSEASKNFQFVVNHLNNAFPNRKVAFFRSDLGGEFISKELSNFLEERGIKNEFSSAYSPQSNGRIERVNRLLIEIARALLYHSGLDYRFWAEAFATAAYVYNRVHVKNRGSKTPFELFYGYKPDVSLIKVFGCEAWTLSFDSKKLDEKSVKCIFIGYGDALLTGQSIRGYRLLLPDGRVIIRRHVRFIEDSFPAKHGFLQGKITEFADFDIVFHDVLQHGLNEDANQEEHAENADIPDENIEDLHDDSSVSLSNVQDVVSPVNIRPVRDRRPPQRYGFYEDDIGLLAYAFVGVVDLNPQDAFKDSLWKESMDKEMSALVANETWEDVKVIRSDIVPISCRWIFNVKRNGSHKSRLVVRGCFDKDNVDKYAPTAPLFLLRLFWILTFYFCLMFRKQFDIPNAFTRADIDRDVYIRLPYPFDKVVKLKKALYGLKDSPRLWNCAFTSFLKSLGYESYLLQPCFFFKRIGGVIVSLLLLYVDDLLGSFLDKKMEEAFCLQLDKQFSVRIEKGLDFLGIGIEDHGDFVYLDQKAFTLNLLDTFGMTDCNGAILPYVSGLNLKRSTTNNSSDFPFLSCIGSLLYLVQGIRFDICWIVCYLARFSSCFDNTHVQAVKHVLRYLKRTSDFKLKISTQDCLKLNAFVDSDFAGCEDTRRSTFGFGIFLGNELFFWKSKLQNSVVLSSFEAEYIALSECIRELMSLFNFLKMIIVDLPIPFISCDNAAAVKVVENGGISKRSKHIDIRYHYFLEKVDKGLIIVQHISGNQNFADLFTKPVAKIIFQKFVSLDKDNVLQFYNNEAVCCFMHCYKLEYVKISDGSNGEIAEDLV
jgi:transposase InsO family protein